MHSYSSIIALILFLKLHLIFAYAISVAASPSDPNLTKETVPIILPEAAKSMQLHDHVKAAQVKSLSKRVTIYQHFTHGLLPTGDARIPYSWIVHLERIYSISPDPQAAATLAAFFDGALQIAQRNFITNVESPSFIVSYGDLILEIRSRGNMNDADNLIPWTVVIPFLNDLNTWALNGFHGVFSGQLVSAFTGWTIWVNFRIRGATPARFGSPK